MPWFFNGFVLWDGRQGSKAAGASSVARAVRVAQSTFGNRKCSKQMEIHRVGDKDRSKDRLIDRQISRSIDRWVDR